MVGQPFAHVVLLEKKPYCDEAPNRIALFKQREKAHLATVPKGAWDYW
jgi:hypothetical protein